VKLIIRQLVTIFATVLIGGFFGALLVRFAPGFGVQERDLDASVTAERRQSMHAHDEAERHVFTYYGHYLSSLVRGDLGYSRSLDRPVAKLLRDRAPETFLNVAAGVAGGWLLGLAMAIPGSWKRAPLYETAASAVAGAFVCIPSAALALLFLALGSPGRIAIALVVFPKVFRFSRNLLMKSWRMPHVLTAKARGLGDARILLRHVLPNVAAPMLALAGVTVSVALGAAIPVEVVCDYPGIGQLAWRAALSRDVPLLVSLTIAIALVTVMANSASDLLAPQTARQS
jgi:peptide/nickel transport system permease protein